MRSAREQHGSIHASPSSKTSTTTHSNARCRRRCLVDSMCYRRSERGTSAGRGAARQFARSAPQVPLKAIRAARRVRSVVCSDRPHDGQPVGALCDERRERSSVVRLLRPFAVRKHGRPGRLPRHAHLRERFHLLDRHRLRAAAFERACLCSVFAGGLPRASQGAGSEPASHLHRRGRGRTGRGASGLGGRLMADRSERSGIAPVLGFVAASSAACSGDGATTTADAEPGAAADVAADTSGAVEGGRANALDASGPSEDGTSACEARAAPCRLERGTAEGLCGSDLSSVPRPIRCVLSHGAGVSDAVSLPNPAAIQTRQTCSPSASGRTLTAHAL
jgi:hypothetical protein